MPNILSDIFSGKLVNWLLKRCIMLCQILKYHCHETIWQVLISFFFWNEMMIFWWRGLIWLRLDFCCCVVFFFNPKRVKGSKIQAFITYCRQNFSGTSVFHRQHMTQSSPWKIFVIFTFSLSFSWEVKLKSFAPKPLSNSHTSCLSPQASHREGTELMYSAQRKYKAEESSFLSP